MEEQRGGMVTPAEPCHEQALNAAALLLISRECLLIPWKLHGHLELHI